MGSPSLFTTDTTATLPGPISSSVRNCGTRWTGTSTGCPGTSSGLNLLVRRQPSSSSSPSTRSRSVLRGSGPGPPGTRKVTIVLVAEASSAPRSRDVNSSGITQIRRSGAPDGPEVSWTITARDVPVESPMAQSKARLNPCQGVESPNGSGRGPVPRSVTPSTPVWRGHLHGVGCSPCRRSRSRST